MKMKTDHTTVIFELLCEKIKQLQDENFMLGLENDCLKKENCELKVLAKEAVSHEKRS